MSYSGNPSLSSDVKQRILSTFDQTLTLAREGNRQEALLGCDFVLRMDPLFQPAQILQERLKSSAGPVRVDDLQAAAPPAAPDPFADLDSLSLDLPDLLPEPVVGGGAAGLRGDWQALLDQRRFEDLMAAALKEHAAVAADAELQRIASLAQERMESEPYVLKFLAAARQALQAGQAAEVGRLLDKARSLDASHPGIAELERAQAQSPAVAAPSFELPSPAAMPGGFAFGEGKSHDTETERRIQELLQEGQAAFDSGDAQGAIDAWSRIFLIDIDHPEASRRIEGARKLKAENERQVEEIFHEGLGHLEDGDLAAARRAFQRVLEIQPGHYAAREYLQQLQSGNVPAAKPAGPRDVPPPAPMLPLPSELGLSGHDPLQQEILVPPDPSELVAAQRKPARKAAAPRGDGRARRLFVLVGGAVLLLTLAAGGYLFLKKDELFPNSEEAAAAPAGEALATDPIARAQRLHKDGKTAIALNQLRRLPPTDPQYQEAQKLITEWGGGPRAAEPAAALSGTDAGAAPAVTTAPAADSRREALLAAARDAYSAGTYLKAKTRFEQAGKLGKLAEADAQLLADAQRRLQPLAEQIDLFHQHEYEFVIRELWDLHESDPGNRDVTQLLSDSYYNLAVRDLQRNDAPKAVENLKEAIQLQRDDPFLQRHYQFAQTYQDRPKDLLYKIYVKYMPFRG